MKKTLLFFFTTALMISFIACNGAKKTEENTPAEQEGVEKVLPSQEEAILPAVKTPEEALKDFEAYVKEYAEAYNNKLKNIQKYQSLAMRSQQEVADMERFKIDFNRNQLKRYETAKKTVEKINTGK